MNFIDPNIPRPNETKEEFLMGNNEWLSKGQGVETNWRIVFYIHVRNKAYVLAK